MNLFKKIVIVFIFLLPLYFPHSIFAQQDFVINNFQSNIAIQTDGRIRINETIVADFSSIQKHGIYRDVPNIYKGGDGNKTYLNIAVLSVTADNTSVIYTVFQNGNYLRIKIGDPNNTISGVHSYVISYTVIGALVSFADHDELYWNVTGNNLPAAILLAKANVFLPQDSIMHTACFEGAQGSTEQCTLSLKSKQQAEFVSSRQLKPGEGLSVVVGFTKGLVPILTARPIKNNQIDIQSFSWSLEAFLVFLLLGFCILMWLWMHHGRDLSLPTQSNTIVVIYQPPNNLRPAEIGTILDERADTLDVTATIIDVATRGFLTITEIPKKWLFGSIDYKLAKTNKDTTELLGYEKSLLTRLFSDGDSVEISNLKDKFYTDLAQVKKILYTNLVEKGFFPDNPESVRRNYILAGVVVMVAGILVSVFGFFNGVLEALGSALFLVGLITIIISRAMPRRTAKGKNIYQQILGYRLFISEAEKYRQQFFEKENMFNEVLPYAIVFGLTKKFANALKDMGIKPIQPAWYYAASPFNPVLFTSNVSNFSESVSTAIAKSPTKSGFSSGSGFSGGGFGGGGGGSW